MDVAELAMTVDSRDLDRAKRASRGLADEAQKTGRTVAASASTMAKNWKLAAAGVAVAVGALRSLGGAVRIIREFESSMSQVGAISRASTQDLAAMRDMAKDLGSTTEFTAAQAADGLKFLAMAGFDAQQSLSAIPDVLDLATASAMGLAQAADITSNIMSAFGIAAEDAADVTDALFAVSSRANTSVEQVGEAMKFVGPVAKAMGISVNDAAAAMGVLSDNGLQGSMAGTGLRKVLSSLVNPTNEAADALEAMGVKLEDVNPTTNELTDIIDTLAAAGISAADALTIFGDRGGPAILALVGNNQRLRSLTGEMQNVAGAATDAATAMRDNLGGDIDSLVSAIQGAAIALGDAGLTAILRTLIQVATAVTRGFTAMVDALASLPSAVATLLGVGSAQRELADAADAVAMAMNEEIAKSDILSGSLSAGRTMSLDTANVKLAQAKAHMAVVNAMQQEAIQDIKASEAFQRQVQLQNQGNELVRDYYEFRKQALALGEEEGRADAERLRTYIEGIRNAVAVQQELLASASEISPEYQAAQDQIAMLEAAIAAADGEMVTLGASTEDARDTTDRLAQIAMGLTFESAVQSARAMSEELGISLATAMKIANMSEDSRAGVSGPDAAIAQLQNSGQIGGELAGVVSTWSSPDREVASGGGGGGGGLGGASAADQAKEQAAQRITALVQAQWNEQQKLNFELERYRTLMNEGVISTDQFGTAQQILQQQMAEAEFANTIQNIESLSAGLMQAAMNGENLGEALVQMLAQMAIQWMAAAIAAKAADILSGGILSASMGMMGGGGGGGVQSLLGFANGTNNAPGGMALVGERGPEIVNLPKGSQVIPNDRTNNAMRQMQPNVSVAPAPVQVIVLDDPRKIDQHMMSPDGERARAKADRRMS